MKAQTRHRLIGGLVLLALAAIFLPLVFHTSEPTTKLNLSAKVVDAPNKPKVDFQLPPPNKTESETILIPNENSAANTPSQTEKEAAQQTPEVTARLLNIVPPPSEPVKKTTVLKSPKTKHEVKAVAQATFAEVLPEAWVVQVASFKNQALASDLVKQLRRKGMDAYSKSFTSNHTQMTRVYVGPEIDFTKIKKTQEMLRRDFRLNGVIKKYQI